MVDVPIEDEDAIRAMNALRPTSRHNGVVENAESHSLVCHSMMTGWADQGVRGRNRTGHDGVDRGNRATGGKPRDPISAAADRSARTGVSAEQLVADLQAWLKKAEESGIAALQEFALRLRAAHA